MTAPATRPGAPGGTAPAPYLLPPELVPVGMALSRRAGERARALLAGADAQARTTLSRAHEEGEAVLDRARRDGRAAARAAGTRRAAEAHRQAREVVLAAREAAFGRLRSDVISGLEQLLSRPDGRPLRSYLAALVGDAAGAPTTESAGPDGRWRAVADGPAGRARLDVEMLVDQILPVFASEIAELWS